MRRRFDYPDVASFWQTRRRYILPAAAARKLYQSVRSAYPDHSRFHRRRRNAVNRAAPRELRGIFVTAIFNITIIELFFVGIGRMSASARLLSFGGMLRRRCQVRTDDFPIDRAVRSLQQIL